MGQVTGGMRRILASAGVYDIFQWLVGGDRTRRQLAEQYIRARAGESVLDIGCGTGTILRFLPAEIEYHGFDPNPDYIATARKRWGERGRFWQETVSEATLERLPPCDVVLGIAVLHHLDDDEALRFFKLAHQALCDGGRLITYDCCYTAEQSAWARRIVSMDRGTSIRWEPEYRGLAEQVFAGVETVIMEKPLRIPYTSLVMECTKRSGADQLVGRSARTTSVPPAG